MKYSILGLLFLLFSLGTIQESQAQEQHSKTHDCVREALYSIGSKDAISITTKTLTIITKKEGEIENTNSIIGNTLEASVFPNPTSSILNVNLNVNSNEVKTIEFYAMNGQMISLTSTPVGDRGLQFNVAGLSKGIYIMSITLNSGAHYHDKFIKN